MKPSHMLLILGLSLLSFSAFAEEFEHVQNRLDSLIGSDVDIALASTRIDGIVQVTAGTEVFFMTEDGQFFIQGRLVDLNTQDDLTECSFGGQVLFFALPLDSLAF